MGWQIEEQVERLFEGFRLREDWIDWIIEHHIKGQDHAASMQKRHATQGRVERARDLYLTGEVDWKSYTVTKNQAEAKMLDAHIPETDCATRAGNHFATFAAEWRSSCVSRRNRTLRTVIEAVYVDLDRRAIVGILPKSDYYQSMLAMAERNDISLRLAKTGHLTGNGRDGGGHDPGILMWPFNVRIRRSMPSKSLNVFGTVIRQSRIALGHSQAGLAARLEIDRKTLRSWENGHTIPAGSIIALLSECLRADLSG